MFNTVCWYLNVIGLAGMVAMMRRHLHRRLNARARYGRYTHPDKVGYAGWVSVPPFGVVAFDRGGDDVERWQYRW